MLAALLASLVLLVLGLSTSCRVVFENSLQELEDWRSSGENLGLATLCTGGGQGAALALEVT